MTEEKTASPITDVIEVEVKLINRIKLELHQAKHYLSYLIPAEGEKNLKFHDYLDDSLKRMRSAVAIIEAKK